MISHTAALVLVAAAATALAKPTVLVTGATGRTGQLLYATLKNDTRIGSVRALVRAGDGATDKARKALHCKKCDATEGIYYGDVTVMSSLSEAVAGVDTVAIAVGASPFMNKTLQRAIEFTGVENQVAALAKAASSDGGALSDKRVVLCSSMGTTDPNPAPYEGGSVLFWKLNAEAMLGSTAPLGTVIVKPCGIEGTYGRGGKQLLVGHDDSLPVMAGSISRADLAAVMAEAVATRATGLRFDLCVGDGPPTTDLGALLRDAHYPWQL